MTFGGEPLLYPEFVCQLHKTAKANNIERRQIITNGLWTKNKKRIDEIVLMIKEVEVTSLLVSIDAFHEKYLDYDIVEYSLNKIKDAEIKNVALHPVWVKNENVNNEYNNKTKELLKRLEYLKFPISSGNILFPAGRAIENFSSFFQRQNSRFEGTCADIPYTDPPNNISGISFNPNGDVVTCNKIGNINEQNIIDILVNYNYKNNMILEIIMNEGCNGLYEYANINKIELNKDGYFSLCELCKDISIKTCG
jgi:sulfatase maturation enzyme AslB (radical SAM superfamily)